MSKQHHAVFQFFVRQLSTDPAIVFYEADNQIFNFDTVFTELRREDPPDELSIPVVFNLRAEGVQLEERLPLAELAPTTPGLRLCNWAAPLETQLVPEPVGPGFSSAASCSSSGASVGSPSETIPAAIKQRCPASVMKSGGMAATSSASSNTDAPD